MKRRAAFLDRDGTLVDDPGFLRDPDQVRLLPRAAAAVRALNDAGWLVVVVTNQSGIARGLLSEAEYHAVARRLEELLAGQGATLDAVYHCPHHPSVSACDCRKPGTAHYRGAAEALGIDLGESVWIGDRLSDLEPAATLGGRGILVLTGEGAAARPQAEERGFAVCQDLAAAVSELLAGPGREFEVPPPA